MVYKNKGADHSFFAKGNQSSYQEITNIPTSFGYDQTKVGHKNKAIFFLKLQ
jgi:hypothetical protein